MPVRLVRSSIVDQVCGALRAGLVSAEWKDWLPPERRLCADLGVGRNTLRAALRVLSREGLLSAHPGRGHRRADGGTRARVRRGNSVILLSPLRLEELRPQQALWVDSLRARLAEAGALLRLLHWPSGVRQTVADS
jgi:DNA-binding FadR family transcriptional regulator